MRACIARLRCTQHGALACGAIARSIARPYAAAYVRAHASGDTLMRGSVQLLARVHPANPRHTSLWHEKRRL